MSIAPKCASASTKDSFKRLPEVQAETTNSSLAYIPMYYLWTSATSVSKMTNCVEQVLNPCSLTLGKKQAYLVVPNGSRSQAFYSAKISWQIAYTDISPANTKPPKHSYATKRTQCRYCGVQIIKACGTYRASIATLHACCTMLKSTLTIFLRQSIVHR